MVNKEFLCSSVSLEMISGNFDDYSSVCTGHPAGWQKPDSIVTWKEFAPRTTPVLLMILLFKDFII